MRLTAENELAGAPAFSNDGQWIAYPSDRAEEGNRDIWIQNLKDGEARRLTTHPSEDADPSFSPDGSLIAYYSDRDGGGLYTVPSAGGAEHFLAPRGREPRFSPDGSRIAYWTGDIAATSPSGHLFAVPTPGGKPVPIAADFADARKPMWSSDGRTLLFTGCRIAPANLEDCQDLWGLEWATGKLT